MLFGILKHFQFPFSDVVFMSKDKSSDFCHANSVGMKNTLFAEQLLGIYEALIEFNFLSCGFSIESSEVITQLFDAHQMLASLLQEKCTAGTLDIVFIL
jgi:hypothetical protein